MKQITVRDIFIVAGIIFLLLVMVLSWDAIIGFLGIVFRAIAPLVVGAAIAYVVAIPTKFIERHMLPNNDSAVVAGMRRPASLVIAAVIMLTSIILATLVFIPAFTETVAMAQERGEQFFEAILSQPVLDPFRSHIETFLAGDLMQSISRLDIMGLAKTAMGGSIGTISTQLFSVVSTVMTGFFGLLFSFILLTDTTDAGHKTMLVLVDYVGFKRAESISMVLGVADASFHNFIVRQCLEALILGSVGAITLFLAGFEYFLGIGVLMCLAALIPIVGYPVGLLAGAFMVAISDPWTALLYVLAVAVAQVLEATFLLPRIGDPRTVLPPVWTTVGVTIGGGVAGFLGMLIAIPTTATIRQLVLIDSARRREKREKKRREAEQETA